MPSDQPTTALIYTRVSTFEQADDGQSLPAQTSECRRYVARHGWDFGDELQDVETGRRDDRAAYQRLLAATRVLAQQGASPIVVVASLDRLGRNIAERVRAYEELKRLGAPIHSVREGGQVSELTYNILAAVAQEESRKLGERVRASLRYVIERGWHPVGRAPWGYQWRSATPDERTAGAPLRALEPHPAEGPYVVEAWTMLADGASLQAIARWAASLPTAARGGRNLRFTAVRMVFRSPVYVARCGARDTDLDTILTHPVGRWAPLISDATWQTAQDSLVRARRIPRQASGQFPLTGLLYCWRCGARMHGRTNPISIRRRRPHRVREYICTGWAEGAKRAGSLCRASVLATAIEAAVIATVGELLDAVSRPRVQAAIRRGWAERERQLHDDQAGRRIADLERTLQTVRRRITALSTKFLDGEIDRVAYDITRADYAAESGAAESELVRLRGQARPARVPPLGASLALIAGWSVGEGASLAMQRKILGRLVERTVPVRVRRGVYEARIMWTPLGWALSGATLEIAPSENVCSVDQFGQTKRSTPQT